MNLPAEFKERMQKMLKDEYPEFEKVFDSEYSHTAIRINTAKSGAEDAVLRLLDNPEQVPWCGSGYYTDKNILSGNHPYHIAGLFYFQEPSAMCVAEALNIAPTDRVLDLCAAPGGKSTQAGSIVGKEGLLVANEIIPKRANILAENTERFGIKNVLVTNESPERLEKKFENFFDKIIVDAPCSGEGMFRKEPQAAEEWSLEHTHSCAKRQLNILNSAAKMLARDGYIVYSTCTFAPCENEGVADEFLKQHLDFESVNIDKFGMLSDGNGAWVQSEHDMSGTKRIFPHKVKGEGHFVALFRKKGGTKNNMNNKLPQQKELKDALTLYRKFERDSLNITLDGNFVLFADNLYRLANGITDIDKIKTVRAGLHLGICKKGRFEPSQALCTALEARDFKKTLNYGCDSTEINNFLKGMTVDADVNGWVCITADGFPLGWGKGSGGIVKNHFPKYLRLK